MSVNNSDQQYISNSEDEEEECGQVVTDFTTYFPDNGCDAFLELAQVSVLDDSDVEDLFI